MTPAMTPAIQEAIIQQASALIARATSPKALLSVRDIEALTTFASRGKTVHDMIRDPSFPRAVMIGSREKRWFSGEVFSWLERRRDEQCD